MVLRLLPALLTLLLASATPSPATDSLADSLPGARPPGAEPRPSPRGYRSFLPAPGQSSAEPARFVLQMLLDRQPQGDSDSYLLQVVFRGKPAPEFVHRVLPDRVEIDFFDTGRPGMRLARVRGGRLTATSLEEFAYRDPKAPSPVRRLVRLTLYLEGRPPFRFRNTLDRTLIHFRLPKEGPEAGIPAGKAPPITSDR